MSATAVKNLNEGLYLLGAQYAQSIGYRAHQTALRTEVVAPRQTRERCTPFSFLVLVSVADGCTVESDNGTNDPSNPENPDEALHFGQVTFANPTDRHKQITYIEFIEQW